MCVRARGRAGGRACVFVCVNMKKIFCEKKNKYILDSHARLRSWKGTKSFNSILNFKIDSTIFFLGRY